MSSGKSGQWCDANLSCLRISTPQKPWSPTAELKTCWPPTMDSRSHHLPALGSTAPFYPWQPWTSSFAQVPELHWRPTLGSPTIPPLTLSLPRILSSVSFLLPQCRSRVSASLRFLLSQVFFLYLERSGSVFVCLLALATFSVFSTYFPSPSFLLPPMPPLCAHCKCGTWEYGRHNAGFFIPSCKTCSQTDWTWKHRNWLTHCLRIVSAWFSFLSKGTKTEPVGQMKDKTFLSSVVCFLFMFFFFDLLNLTDILSVPRLLCSLCLFHVCICDF